MNKMILSTRTIRKLLFSVAMLLAFQTGFSQSNEAAVIERLVKDYARAYENITRTRDKQTVLRFVSKDLFSTIIKSNVVDNFGLIQSSYADFDNYLEQILRTDGMQVKYEIKDILRSRARGRSGVVVCEVAVETSSKGEIWNKGTELTTFTLKQFKDGWKILNFNVVSLEDEQNKGTCLTQIFKGRSGDYMVKTIVPQGSTYSNNVNNFEFNPGNGIIYISVDGENSYSWLRDGPITRLANGNAPEEVIGPAIDEYEAVLNIVKLDLYESNCLNFKIKN